MVGSPQAATMRFNDGAADAKAHAGSVGLGAEESIEVLFRAVWGCPHTARNRSSMLSSAPSPTEPAWAFASAAPSLNRMVAACGLPTISHTAQVFLSPCPTRARDTRMTRKPGAQSRFLIQSEGCHR